MSGGSGGGAHYKKCKDVSPKKNCATILVTPCIIHFITKEKDCSYLNSSEENVERLESQLMLSENNFMVRKYAKFSAK